MTKNNGLVTSEDMAPSVTISPIIRVFGELRFHTAGEPLALVYRSPDVLCSVEEPGVLRQWNVKTGEAAQSTFLSDLETVWSFCPEGRALITASDEVSVWDVDSAELITSLMMPSWVTAVTVRRDPALIATGHDEGIVRLWDPAGHRLVRELAGHDRPIAVLAISPDGQRLASAGEDRIICIWEIASGRQIGTLGRHSDRIGSLIWHPDGRLLFSAAWDRTARVWDTNVLEPVMLLNTHADQVVAMAASRDGTMLACADSAPSVHIWDVAKCRESVVLTDFDEEVRCLAFSPDGNRLAAGCADGAIRFWDPRQAVTSSESHRPRRNRGHLACCPRVERLMAADASAGIRAWNVKTGEPVRHPVAKERVEVFAASPDGRWLALGSDRQILLLDAETGHQQATCVGQNGEVAALIFAPDSRMFASASSDDGTVWLWSVPDGEPKLVVPIAADTCTVEALAFHPSGRLIAVGGIDCMATGGSDGAICIWDIVERQLHVTFNRGTTSLAFHPSGRFLAAASLDHMVHVWDLESQQLSKCLDEHGDAVGCVCFSPCGRWLISGCDDRIVRVWDLETGELAVSHPLDSVVKGLLFSPDGRHLFTCNANTTNYQLDFTQLLEECRA